MPTGTISYHIASEVVGIDVGSGRYRATRSSRVLEATVDGTPAEAAGPWTLWHDDRDGGSHSVGHAAAYVDLSDALAAAAAHGGGCHR